MATSTYALVSWGFGDTAPFSTIDVLDVFAGRYAFAAITKTGSAITWGSRDFPVPEDLNNVKWIVPSDEAFVAIQQSGHVKAWGNKFKGGEIPNELDSMIVEDVIASSQAFAAITTGGNVSYWGPEQGSNPERFESIKGALVNVVEIKSTRSAFAAITETGAVVPWGHSGEGGRIDDLYRKLKLKNHFTDIYHTQTAFAALNKNSGEVVAWGSELSGGKPQNPAQLAANVTKLFSNAKAFVALKSTGDFVTWGDALSGGDSSDVRTRLLGKQIQEVYSTTSAFAALLAGGEVVTWGSFERGGDSSSVRPKLQSKVQSIASNNYAFAALREGGEVITWGDTARGGDSSLVSKELFDGVKTIVGNNGAFAAIKEDGRVVVWGLASNGGRMPDWIFPKLRRRVHKIVAHPNGKAFAALVCLPKGDYSFNCSECPKDQIWNSSKLECEVCKQDEVPDLNQTTCSSCRIGEVPTNDGSTCIPCNPTEFVAANRITCKQCPANTVPSQNRTTCVECESGEIPFVDGKCKMCDAGFRVHNAECVACDSSSYAEPGALECTPCEPSWIVKKAADGKGCQVDFMPISALLTGLIVFSIVVILLWFNRRRRLQLLQEMIVVDKTNIEKMQACLHRALKAQCLSRRGRKLREDLANHLNIQEGRYTTFDAITLILDEGNLKMLHANIITDAKNQGDRMIRQQDIEERCGEEAFWSGRLFQQRVRMIAAVAISYCWCHPIHPDPKGVILKILRHAMILRLQTEGKGLVQDIAVFLDFMSLPQDGEEGSQEDPSPGQRRTPAENEKFRKGLRVVNIPYACQLVETWIIAWAPDGVEHKYEDRGWPTFERAVSSLVKDSKNLVCLSYDTLQHNKPIDAFNTRTLKRVAPQTPARFNENIDRKKVTSAGDIDFLKMKYKETFIDVIGHGKSLWFANLDWGDDEAAQLCDVFQHCDVLVTVILSGNCFSTEAARKLVEKSGDCSTLQSMDLADNQIDESEHDCIRNVWNTLGKKPTGLNLLSRKGEHGDLLMQDMIVDTDSHQFSGEGCALLEQELCNETSLFLFDKHLCRSKKKEPQGQRIGVVI